MATLQEQRQAIAQGMAASRAPTGAAERQATGAAMVARRTGRSIKDDLNALETPTRQRAQLRDLERRGARPPTPGVGTWNPANQSSNGTAGIASPLIEKTKVVDGKTLPDNELWPQGHTSSDGLFVLPAVKTERFIDANGAEEVRNYANPAGVPV